jgi:ADP-ribosylglycohydrolase
MDHTIKNKIKGGLYGLIVGDALGVPYEFRTKEEMKSNPCIDMIGYGTYNLPKGTWSDDSSLTLATVDALIEGYSLNIMAKNFLKWLSDGEYAPYGRAFDVGGTTLTALFNLKNGMNPRESGAGGENNISNGSLMRILPIPLCYSLKYLNNEITLEKILEKVHEVSSITHSHPRVLIACGIYSLAVLNILKGEDKKTAYFNSILLSKKYYSSNKRFKSELIHFDRVLSGNIIELNEDELCGSGYVIDTLETSLWAFLNSNSYKDGVLKAINIGDDTDTCGAIAGGLCGVYYGYSSIPKEWIDSLARKDWIDELIEKFAESIIME